MPKLGDFALSELAFGIGRFSAVASAKGACDAASGRMFTGDEIRTATGNKKLESVDDMTFGKYKRVLNGDERWKSLKLGSSARRSSSA